MEDYVLDCDMEYTLYLFEQRALSLKGVALHYDCECLMRSEASLKYNRMNENESAAN